MNRRVVIVDDSLTVRMDLGEALQAAGIDTVLCPDLRSAREALKASDCALVILDLLLPDGDGVEFLKELRSAAPTAGLPVILLSSEAEVKARVRAVGAGANEYVGKPYDLAQVVARARAVVGSTAGTGSAKRVLVIDDSPTFREELRQALENQGYTVEDAATGEAGLARAAALRPDAIVVDGMLPGIDGATVVRRLKSDNALRGTPCLLLTSADGAADELRALEAGADAYVRKSEDLRVVLMRLAALLRGATIASTDVSTSLLGPKRLLAVDDSVTYLEELGSQLRQEGYDVVLAKSGEEALELLSVQDVDCILLDLVMPGLSGQETCKRIKQSPDGRDIPLVILSARDDRDAMIEGMNAGADDYITKSADFDVVKARLRAQLRRKHFEDENRRIREKLVRRETEARFQRLIHSNIIGVILSDLAGGLADANDAFLGMLGYSRAELDAKELRLDALTPPEWRKRDEAAIEQLRRSGSATPYEKELLRRDGARLPVVIGAALLEGTEMVIGFVLDRTEQKVAEEKLRGYATALEAANRELAHAKARAERESQFKSKFLASVSHELRTPLNAIIGFSELLEQELFGSLAPKQKEHVRNVLSSGRHLLTLVNDILDLSKVEAGRMDLTREWTPLALVVDAVQGVIQPLSDKGGVGISIELPEALPDVYIDAVRIKQVLYNLLSNAIKFTPRGGHVRLTATRDGNELVVKVSDTGVGIRKEDLPRLFREFEQLDSGRGAKTEGTGLGLALTKRLVALHGGRIYADSKPGEGSTFTFTLPVLARDTAPRRFEQVRVEASDAPVLVVEHDPQATELIAGQLRAAGLSVAVARSAEEAIAQAEDLRPVAVTLEISMPGVDGWGVLARLKSNERTREIPVVVVSVVDQPNRGFALGATDYLVKPVSRDALLQSLEASGVPVQRVAGIRVLVAGPGDGELDPIEAILRQAGCDVQRRPALAADDAMDARSANDLVVVSLLPNGGEGIASTRALVEKVSALAVPVLGIVADGELRVDPSWRAELVTLPLREALVPERLVRAVRQVVDTPLDEPASRHRQTGLPSPLALRAHLRSVVQRAERERKRVLLILVRVSLPRTTAAESWLGSLRPHVRTEDYVAVAGDELLAFVLYGTFETGTAGLVRRVAGLVETTLTARVLGATELIFPEDGRTVDELFERAFAWAAAERERR